MAVTPGGNFYIQSSDLVANYPATSLAIANRLDKYALNPYTDATERDFLIQFPVQGQLAQTLDDNKAWKYDGTAWAPFSGAVSAANFTDTATGTYTDGGVNYKYLTFTGTGSVTIDEAGFADVLVVAGGGGGSAGSNGGNSGGGGGGVINESLYLTARTYAITIGSGGAVTVNGNPSGIGFFAAVGGAGGPNGNGLSGKAGGSGSGGQEVSGAAGTGFPNQGNNGGAGSGSTNAGGGGGGAGGAGVSSAVNIAGNGGVGVLSSITGTATFYAGGGGGSVYAGGTRGLGGSGGGGNGGNSGTSGSAGTANTGGGGGSEDQATGYAGGSGIVIIRVVV